ncbi:hypothetical protein PRUPE_8G005000 [Prunus persica]|uniref:Uncharacterized protein n=1 Tax=Prunus persica TaxID=3760 RepID=A0A251MU90_PRUPE|nr:hypothetical protein PRUPE_8G005000 [Prunus persica]
MPVTISRTCCKSRGFFSAKPSPTTPPCTSLSTHCAGGLVAALEPWREGHKVVVSEQGDQVGSTWVSTPKVESDPLGLHPDRTTVHSSMHQSIRTNLPRESMGFKDYPFVAKEEDEKKKRPEKVFRVTERC